MVQPAKCLESSDDGQLWIGESGGFTDVNGILVKELPSGIYEITIKAVRKQSGTVVRGTTFIDVDPAKKKTVSIEIATRRLPVNSPPEDLIKAALDANCKTGEVKQAIRELEIMEAHHSIALADLNQVFARLLDRRVKRLTGPSRERYQRELRRAPADGRSQAIRAIADDLENQLREFKRQRKKFGKDFDVLVSEGRLQALKDDVRFLEHLSVLHARKEDHEKRVRDSREGKARLQKLLDTEKSRCPKEPPPTHSVNVSRLSPPVLPIKPIPKPVRKKCDHGAIISRLNCVTEGMDD